MGYAVLCKQSSDRKHDRGDTIVEVMFAIAIFAAIASGSLAIMNRGVQTTQRSLEISQVRQAMNDQAELLRYVEQNALSTGDTSGLWATLTTTAYQETTVSPYGHLTAGQCPQSSGDLELGAKPFIIDPAGSMTIRTNSLFGNSSTVAYPQIVYTGGSYQGTYGLWIEEQSKGTNDYIDFNIRACWNAPGSAVPVTLGTIVRLYAQ